MSVKYIICKNSRNESSPYSGPACKAAGIKPGKIYTDSNEAIEDAKKLTYVNPVGFIVHRLIDGRNVIPIEVANAQLKDFPDIYNKMWIEGIPPRFIDNAISLAKHDHEIYDLLVMWQKSSNHEEKQEIIQDLNELIEDKLQK
jgi:hypothetical protein